MPSSDQLQAHRLKNEHEAAEYLSLSHLTLRKWRCVGGGPDFVRLGAKAIRYRSEDLDAWVTSQVVSSTSAADARQAA